MFLKLRKTCGDYFAFVIDLGLSIEHLFCSLNDGRYAYST